MRINFVALLFLEKYGWFVILGIVVAVFIWSKLEPYLKKWKEKRDKRIEEENIGKTFKHGNNCCKNSCCNLDRLHLVMVLSRACSINDVTSPVCLQISTIIAGFTIGYSSFAFI